MSDEEYRAGAMNLNLVVPIVVNLKFELFHCTKSQNSSVSIEPFSKIMWFHGTTGTTTNAGPRIHTYIIWLKEKWFIFMDTELQVPRIKRHPKDACNKANRIWVFKGKNFVNLISPLAQKKACQKDYQNLMDF